MSEPRTGVWLIGAGGEIATTVMVGALAVRAGLAPRVGLVSDLPPLAALDLVGLDALVFGGLDVRRQRLVDTALDVAQRSRTFPADWVAALSPELAGIDEDLAADTDLGWQPAHSSPADGPHLLDLAGRLQDRLRRFADRHDLARVIVVDLASAEPPVAPDAAQADLGQFERLIAENRKDLIAPSMLYAYAAFHAGCPHVNFTPNTGAAIPALHELALQRALPYCGNDGKTGETLVKTALAPMFAQRNLRVLSWEGTNMLGNNDGRTLEDPVNRANKIRNKAAVLEQILGYPLHADVSINYVPSLGDWKTAWDLIHFQGFLGVPMTMQFTWQGCDSILAAPLVLDLVRLCEHAARQGVSGTLPHLASFFKNPIGVQEMDLYRQFQRLLEYAHRYAPPPTENRDA